MIATLQRAVSGNAARKLEASIKALLALGSERVEIDGFYASAIDAWRVVERQLRDAEAGYKKALAEHDLSGVKKPVSMLPLLRLQIDNTHVELTTLSNLARGGVPFAQFVKEHPKARETLLGVVRAKLQQGEGNAASELVSAKKSLPDWANASASPKVKQANSLVDQLTTTLARIESSKLDEGLWRTAIEFLE